MTDAKYAKAISPAGISCGAQLVEKASQSFAPYGRERDCNHFRRRRVRRRKYFSRSAVSNCPPLADNRGAKRSAGPHRPLAAGGLYCQKRPSRAFFDSLSPAGISCGADSIFRFTRSRQGRPRGSAPLRRRAPGGPSPRPGTARTRRCPSRSSRRPARRYPAA